MTLQVRLILITFVIILIASIATAVIYYNLTGQLLSNYQSKDILNSTNDFVFTFQSRIEQTDDDFSKIFSASPDIEKINLDSTGIDFIFTLVNDSLISNTEFKVKSNSYINFRSRSFKQLFVDNPNLILRYAKINNGQIFYYGVHITSGFLDKISEKIRADIALVINDSPVEFSNSAKNQVYLLNVINAIRELKFKNNFDLYKEEIDNADFEAAAISPHQILTPGAKISFVVFKTYQEGVGLKNTLRDVMLIILTSGSSLAFIFILLFTTKLRKQIGLLSEGAEITRKGDLNHRVQIVSNDELGRLGEAFNQMLNELKKKDDAEKEYTDFISLINQSSTLKEVSETSLNKIIKSTGMAFGVLYMVDEKNLRLISSTGIGKNIVKPSQEPDLYSNAIDKKEVVEFNFSENFPEIKTGLTSIKIKYILIYPIVYNRETIAILELASDSEPGGRVRNYIDNIQEQLAFGLVNARSLEQLENYVVELRRLNEEYQKQNKQIIEQNDELKELHRQINEKALELEKQRIKAVELTKVKSQFLASMSHELRTPLISILGLTELILKDDVTPPKSKERMGIVYRNGKKLLGMITNILEFSKFESGRIEIKKDNFLLSDLLEDINTNIHQIASDKNLKFVIESPSGKNLLLNTDKSKLEQILNNLITNAVKFTESGAVKLTIVLQNNLDLNFSVSDTGIGISEENQKIIFSEFRQIDSGSSRKYGGAGLGLTITKRYVELLGGALSLNSQLSKGSEFSFVLHDIVLDIFDVPLRDFLTIHEDTGKDSIKKTAYISCKNSDTLKFITDYLHSYDYELIPYQIGKIDLNNTGRPAPEAFIFCCDDIKENLIREVAEIKSNPSGRDAVIILISILENEKVGWLPAIFDYIVEPATLNEIERVVKNLELFSQSRIPEIVFASRDPMKFKSLISNENTPERRIKFTDDLNSLITNPGKDSSHMVIVDFDSFKSDALEFLLKVEENRLNRNFFTVLNVSKDNLEKEFEWINSGIKELTLQSKNHPLDVLKSLKERLMIDSGLSGRNNNLIEEKIGDNFSVVGDNGLSEQKQTILIVDDDPDTLFTIGEFVKELNYETVFAHNGTECLLMLNHINPDLILLDIMMPQMDGFETVKRIRSENRVSSIPVIALTAYAMLDNKEVVTKNGFNDLVTKPINSTLLASKISMYINSRIDVK